VSALVQIFICTLNLGISKGEDALANVIFDATTIATLAGLTLKSHGVGLTYVLTDTHTITASANGNTIFTASINAPTDSTGATQSITFTLLKELDHTGLGADSLAVALEYTIIDIDSSVTTNATNRLVIDVIDDVPLARSEPDLSVAEGGCSAQWDDQFDG
jgi:hypothetical protein